VRQALINVYCNITFLVR